MINDHVHYWIIDSNNVGRCRDCPEVRDFGKLLRKQGVFAIAGHRGADASKIARNPYGRKGRPRKYE